MPFWQLHTQTAGSILPRRLDQFYPTCIIFTLKFNPKRCLFPGNHQFMCMPKQLDEFYPTCVIITLKFNPKRCILTDHAKSFLPKDYQFVYIPKQLDQFYSVCYFVQFFGSTFYTHNFYTEISI